MSKQWYFAACVVIASFAVAGFTGTLIAISLRTWVTPVAGFLAAFAVVVSAYLSAPHHKLTSAVATFIAGAILAWFFLRHSVYPESYGKGFAYAPTVLPLVVTYAGGLLGCLVVMFINALVGHNNLLKLDQLE